jgi:Skp family chaperone for outer membrane proteins
MRTGANFTRILLLTVVVTASACLLAKAQPNPGQPTAPARPPKIAVINPFMIFDQLPEKKDMDATIATEYNKDNVDLAAQADKIKRLTAELQNIRPNHPQYADQVAKIDQAKLELEMAQKMAQIKLERRRKAGFIQIYSEIEEAVAAVAQQQQIDLVITDNRRDIPTTDLNNLTYNAVTQFYSERSVLFATKTVDITDLVLARLAQMNAAQKNAAPPRP